ncbi:hypothetical protein R3P38DRAFT_3212617 [Favolaschia claudopus]|uniref:Zn(2)-C6 fungal-type domain-containing protein n=1 Tax=Favolaschia claudopus TaxID=2862362 RepID=A0AAW0AEX5_9AGAR
MDLNRSIDDQGCLLNRRAESLLEDVPTATPVGEDIWPSVVLPISATEPAITVPSALEPTDASFPDRRLLSATYSDVSMESRPRSPNACAHCEFRPGAERCMLCLDERHECIADSREPRNGGRQQTEQTTQRSERQESPSFKNRESEGQEMDVSAPAEFASARPSKRLPNACAQCKTLRVKCEFQAGAERCMLCLTEGRECFVDRPISQVPRRGRRLQTVEAIYQNAAETPPSQGPSMQQDSVGPRTPSPSRSEKSSSSEAGHHDRRPEPVTKPTSKIYRFEGGTGGPANPTPYDTPQISLIQDLYSNGESGIPLPVTSSGRCQKISSSARRLVTLAVWFIFVFILGQVYLHFLLRIRALYFSRVNRIFEDSQISLPDLKRMARTRADEEESPQAIWPAAPDQTPLPQHVLRFRSSAWENFIDSLLREWKQLNIISVLLMSAILTMLQIDAASHPITRTSALFSLLCALMSLLYGCLFIIRFGTMRTLRKISSFANEARRQYATVWWNTWVLLAMPAVWSIIAFLTCIMSFIWLSGSSQDVVDVTLSPRVALGSRIGLTAVYGEPLEPELTKPVNEWTVEALDTSNNRTRIATSPYGDGPQSPPHSDSQRGSFADPQQQHPEPSLLNPIPLPLPDFETVAPSVPPISYPLAFFKKPRVPCTQLPSIPPTTIVRLGQSAVEARPAPYPDSRWADAVTADDLGRFVLDISSAWKGQLRLARPETSQDLPVYTVTVNSSVSPNDPVQKADDGAGTNPQRDQGSITTLCTPQRGFKSPKHAIASPNVPPVDSPSDSQPNIHLDKNEDTAFIGSPRSPSDEADGARTEENSDNVVHSVQELLDLWNEQYFRPRSLRVNLVKELPLSEIDSALAVTLASLNESLGI